jgi:FkbM family methyltransferase
MWDPYINYSYSQEGEDMVLKRIFDNQTNGFYIDIGAHHPKRFSNTYNFYLKGWKGINIDAMPRSMDLFNKIRPRDINLELGVGQNEEELNFYTFNEPALNSFSKELSETRDKAKDSYFIRDIIKVEVKPLYKILDIYLINSEIDFLNVDVEGFDLEVLKSNDWSKYRPKFVLVEILSSSLHNIDKDPIFQLMKEKNYFIFSKQVNTVFFKDNFLKN